jgi:hypothetical protein
MRAGTATRNTRNTSPHNLLASLVSAHARERAGAGPGVEGMGGSQGHQANRRRHGLDLAGGTARPGAAGRAGQRSSPQWHMSYGQHRPRPPSALRRLAQRGQRSGTGARSLAAAAARAPGCPAPPATLVHFGCGRSPPPPAMPSNRGARRVDASSLGPQEQRIRIHRKSTETARGFLSNFVLGNLSAGNRRSCCLLWGNRLDDSVAARLVRMI